MRALTLWQPHATLLVTPSDDDPTVPVKKVENRPRPIPSTLTLPVRVGIHAAKKPAPPGDIAHLVRLGVSAHDSLSMLAVRGVLVGFVTFTDQHHVDECEYEHGDTSAYSYCSRWAMPGDDVWHYTPRYPIPLADPVPMRGYQGWWTLPEEVLS